MVNLSTTPTVACNSKQTGGSDFGNCYPCQSAAHFTKFTGNILLAVTGSAYAALNETTIVKGVRATRGCHAAC